jgi:hypothetical protein
MYVDFNEFKKAIAILKNFSSDDISNSLQPLLSHRTLLQDNYQASVIEIKHTLIHFKKYELQMNFRMNNIQAGVILPLVPILKNYQQASVYPDATSSAVNQIIAAKKEVDAIRSSIEEKKLRVAEKARKAKMALDKLDTISFEISTVETAIDLISFFNTNDYDPKGFANFELSKYYNLYIKGASL